jgi:hypothetical protein
MMRLWYALSLLVLALAPLGAAAQILSPGPLARPHRQLEGSEDCLKCHQKSKGVQDALCLDCHTVLNKRIRAKKGYHGTTLAGRRCTKCHKDHLGLSASMIRWPSGGREQFPHRDTGYPLKGKHTEAKCDDCHTRSRMVDPQARALKHTYLGLSTRCAKCHQGDNPHGAEFAGRACTDCHDQQSWTELAGFDHDATRFKLVGKHTEAKCDDCHTSEAFAATARDCASCHAQPHPAATKFPARCDRCHKPQGWSRITFAASAHTFFPLTNGHKITEPNGGCRTCHGDQGNRAPKADCASCHTDPHQGRLGQSCQKCHNTRAWAQVKRSAVDHERTRFPLRGAHKSTDCTKCHLNGRMAPIAHDQCTDCHEDVHGDAVQDRCEDCHAMQAFQPATYRLAEHTTFALDGAHQGTACTQCHRPEAAKGWDFRIGVKACAECHTDPHEAQFKPRVCTDCHGSSAWQPATGFDHEAAWPLKEAHAKVDCAHCHPDGRYAGTPTACEDCHGSPHLGQFADARSGIEARPAKACADCHSQKTWKGEYQHTIWPLEGAHTDAKCVDCHHEARVADGRVTTRWRLGFQDCKRCHQNPHERRP